MTFVKWYTRISSAIGTIVILIYLGDTIVDWARTAAEFLADLGAKV